MDWLYDLLGVKKDKPVDLTPRPAKPDIDRTLTEYKFRVVTTVNGRYQVQYSVVGAEPSEYAWKDYHSFSATGLGYTLSSYVSPEQAIHKVDELLDAQTRRIYAVKNAGKVIYGPLP